MIGSTTSGVAGSTFGAWCAKDNGAVGLDEHLHVDFGKEYTITALGTQGKPLQDGTISICVTKYLPIVYAGGWKAMKDEVWVEYVEADEDDYDVVGADCEKLDKNPKNGNNVFYLENPINVTSYKMKVKELESDLTNENQVNSADVPCTQLAVYGHENCDACQACPEQYKYW